MKIGIDARFYGTIGKGLGRYTEKLLQSLELLPGARQHEFYVFLRQENFDEYTPKASNIHKIRAFYQWYGWQEQILLPLLLWRLRLDLVHFPHFNVPIFVPCPFVTTIHDLILFRYPTVKASELPPFLYWLKYAVYRAVIVLAIWRSRSILTVSEFTRRDLEILFPRAKKKTVVTLEAAESFCEWMNPGEALRALASWEIEEVKSFALYVGNAYPHKNLECILPVATLHPHLLFCFVGREDYFYRRFRSQVEDAGLTNIRFLGHVSDQELGVLYRYAIAYIFPSRYEGFGLPGLEALQYGLPLLVARAGSLPEIYQSAASYFHPDKPMELNQLLDRVIMKDQSLPCPEIGYARAFQFSWRRLAEQTLALYEKAVPR